MLPPYLCNPDMNICDLKTGGSAVIRKVGGQGALRQHLLDMGLIPGSRLKVIGVAPMGDPLEIFTHGYSLTLPREEALRILVEETSDSPADVRENEDFSYNLTLHEHNAHPGLGEEGKYHHHEDEVDALPKDAPLTLAIVGQHNCGKTALFNRITGLNLHVGNFPGVTTEKEEGFVKGRSNVKAVDLPGLYSLSPYTEKEKITRDFLLEKKPECIINVVDAGNLERNFYLTVQLMELGMPMVVAVNMMDELRGNDGSIRINEMERILGVPVVPIAAATGEGVEELLRHAVHVARYREAPVCRGICDVPEKESGLDRAAAMADARYSFIGELCARTVKRPVESREYRRSRRIDRVLTGKWTAIPIFLAVMTGIIYLSVDALGFPLQRLLGKGIQHLSDLCAAGMEKAGVAPAIMSLVTDGVFGGVGSIVSFVPVIIILFFFLSMLEDSGYMGRVAFVTDKLLRRIGLSGRSIVPLLIGFGCSVPAVMAARTLPSSRDRRMTILLTPFVSCSAKIPVYAFISSTFFPGYGGLVLVCLYLLGLLTGVLVALVRKLLARNVEASPFVMELPNYRLPQLRNVSHLLWDKTKDFIVRAFTVIFFATIVIWVLQSFNWKFDFVPDGNGSMLAAIAGWMAPAFSPLGVGDWRVVTAFISGFLGKESIIATMQVLGVKTILTPATAVSVLVFCLLYTPCVAAIAAVRRELGVKWTIFMVVFQCTVAWVAAFAAYHIALLLV